MMTADAAEDVSQRLDRAARSVDHATVSAVPTAVRTMAALTIPVAMLAMAAMAVAVVAVRTRRRGRRRGRENEERKNGRTVPHEPGFRRRRMNRE